MKKVKQLILYNAIILSSMIAATHVYADKLPEIKARTNSSSSNFENTASIKNKIIRKFDLALSSFTVTNCVFRLTISNSGTQPVPNTAYSRRNPVYIDIKQGKKLIKKIPLYKIDPLKKLSANVKAIDHTWRPSKLEQKNIKPGSNEYTALLNEQTLKGAKPSNNTIKTRGTCGQKAKNKGIDLALTNVTLRPDCYFEITVQNIGGPIPDEYYDGYNDFYSTRISFGLGYFDASRQYQHILGLTFPFLDGVSRALQQPGGRLTKVFGGDPIYKARHDSSEVFARFNYRNIPTITPSNDRITRVLTQPGCEGAHLE